MQVSSFFGLKPKQPSVPLPTRAHVSKRAAAAIADLQAKVEALSAENQWWFGVSMLCHAQCR